METMYLEDGFSIYSVNEDGTYNELEVWPENNICNYNRAVSAADFVDRNEYRATFEVSENVFCAFAVTAYHNMQSDFDEYDIPFEIEAEPNTEKTDDIDRKINARHVLSQSLVLRGLHGQATKKEMRELCNQDIAFPQGNYWDMDLMEQQIHAVSSGSITVSDFCDWCILMMRCCYKQSERYHSVKGKNLRVIARHLDGIAFMNAEQSDEKRQKKCREILASLRYENHLFTTERRKYRPPFTFVPDVYTYVSWCAYGAVGDIYRVCIADEVREKVNYFYAFNIDFAEDVAYMFLTATQFENLLNLYYEYEVDAGMDLNFARTKR